MTKLRTCACVIGVILVISTTPAIATFPGTNGRIAASSKGRVVTMNADGSNRTVLRFGQDPVWSPDGSQIAYVARGSAKKKGVFVMNEDGSNPTRVTSTNYASFDPSWSPSGKRLVFTAARGGDREIHTVTVNGSGLEKLTNNTVNDDDPAWSPDGGYIVFTRKHDIYRMRAGGANVRNLTKSSGMRELDPVWHPNGKKIVFITDLGDTEVCTMGADGSGIVAITSNRAAERWPTWSPDGTKILFSTNRDGDFELFKMRPDGSRQGRVTTNGIDEIEPDWEAK